MKQLQTAINDWQNATFPKTTSIAAAVKLNGEVAELMEAISTGKPVHDIAEELADIIHLVCDVARTYDPPLDIDFHTWRKLSINHDREWDIRSDGTGQHVDG